MGISFEPERLGIVRLETSTGVVALALSGELDAGTTPKLSGAVVRLLGEEREVLVLDLSDLAFIGAAGARSIRLTHDAAGATRLRVVTGGNRLVEYVLRTTGFAAVLDCYPTRSAALHAGSRTSFVSRANASWNVDR
ncbi:STAS domain-containing protein [Amycolatopsis sp. OK19-0408]|uniref:STAS domain-containing protein n=1 Tax=Amycolatopsis iheyensis TaxID=2945988 RepID=A0A9X2NIW3_9PSEU|nr:STAS domain-containing protein [Amycolatopsis iheyensis]MCR6489616.1 STAS domain-containing protein [Amycolatopsis iheyensis]